MSFMTIDFTQQDWFQCAETQAVFEALSRDGAEVRAIGGCVRDTIMGRMVQDVDMATTLPPDQTRAFLEKAGLKAVPTGLDHGTITAVVNKHAYEITTLRKDVATDGRRAVVAFTTDWQVDAERRDFTLNAMSVTPQGQLYDPCGGYEDAMAGRLRFIGDAQARVAEDSLRILRFFRFYTQFGKGPLDPVALAACRDHHEDLKALSGERIAAELWKILSTPQSHIGMNLLHKNGILRAVLPDVGAEDCLEKLCPLEKTPDPALRLMALLPADQQAIERIIARLKLSKALSQRLRKGRGGDHSFAPTQSRADRETFLYRRGGQAAQDQLLLYWARAGKENLTAEDIALLGLGVAAGPIMGDMLKALEHQWCADGCQASYETCLEWAQDLALAHKRL